MVYNERAEIILQQAQLQPIVKINELAEFLHVSVDTVRRDLRTMEQSGLIACIRGGACLPDAMPTLTNFSGREIINSELKRAAASKAVKYVKEGALIALNSGTTNTILAQELVHCTEKFTVVTNNMAAANILMQNPSINLIMIGGSIDSTEKSTYGTACEEEFGKYYPDIAFLSVNAVSLKEGFTDFRFFEIGIIRLLAANAKKSIAVMDSSKFEKCSRRSILNLNQINLLITDDGVPECLKEKYNKKGILVK